MVKVNINGREIYYDGYLKANLDGCKKLVKKDWDMVFAVDGEERSGKSVFAQQAALYCDSTFGLQDIVFNPEDFEKKIDEATQYKAVVYDEAYGGLNSKQVLSRVSQILVKKFTEIGRKNLFIFVVLPCFFEMHKYVAIWRSRALFHVYHKNYERGRFACWSGEDKKFLYINGKKFYSYAKPKPSFIGSFSSGYTVDRSAYENKKEKETAKPDDPTGVSIRNIEVTQQRNAIFYVVSKLYGKSYTKIASDLNKVLPNDNKLNYEVVQRGGFRFEKEMKTHNYNTQS